MVQATALDGHKQPRSRELRRLFCDKTGRSLLGPVDAAFAD
jgi:hypothetical protein